jgi:hypothetical protein
MLPDQPNFRLVERATSALPITFATGNLVNLFAPVSAEAIERSAAGAARA